ncbi:hypothetical protein TTHERM_00992730 (macronuclear) [Tetrahymena thermophila SB210]|uniref:hypothetical protein n=1 Tax=Tetrahymena thermophila (strain SB210) TaxID=312017 RepID=UPI0003F24D19|nr:hypothetical protein TTHERM_00992730 [Tetrahymena thermophila SB210]EAR83273.3 hypothetical protein TTHERM_00992730 [Tetrahymena thermophila SB210]|eukprot:XP_001030936.3 hypothetical protein TTHERM_00992730 [Tetrahymena thermophila SB210]
MEKNVRIQEAVVLNQNYLCLLVNFKGIQIWRFNEESNDEPYYQCVKTIQKNACSALSYSNIIKRLLFVTCQIKIESYYLNCDDSQNISIKHQRSVQLIANQNEQNLNQIQKIQQISQKGSSFILIELGQKIILLNNNFKMIRSLNINKKSIISTSILSFEDRFQSSQYLRYYNYLSKSSKSIVITGQSRYFILWDIYKGTEIKAVNAHQSDVCQIKYLRLKGKWDMLATSARRDNEIKIWELTSLQCISTLKQSTIKYLLDYNSQLKYLLAYSILFGKKTNYTTLEIWKINQISQKQLIIKPLDKLIKVKDIQVDQEQGFILKNQNLNDYPINKNYTNILKEYFNENISQIIFHGDDKILVVFLTGNYIIQKVQIEQEK